MYHHDLTSLALDSDAIVLARITTSRVEGYREIKTHEVLDVYAGELARGDVVEVDYGALRFEDPWGPPEGWEQPSDEVVLFLEHDERNVGWRLVDSGLRIFVGGVVYRFEQGSNPGPYLPVVQGHDPYDVFEDPRGGPGLTRAELEVELRAAIDRAALVREALTQVDTPAGRARLLGFIGPAWGEDDDEPFMFGDFSAFQDTVTAQILSALADAGDTDALLEGVSRVRGGVMIMTSFGLRFSELLTIASDHSRPINHRIAALQLLGAQMLGTEAPRTADSLASMLGDPDPRIRAAAAAISVDADSATQTWRRAIVDRLALETEPAVRYNLVSTALDHQLLGEAELSAKMWPVVAAERRGRAFELRWIDPSSGWGLESLAIEARSESGELRALQLVPGDAPTSRWGSTHRAGVYGWLLFDPPLPDARTQIEIVARLASSERIHEVRLPLRALGEPPEPAPAPELEPTPAPPGCACGLGQPPSAPLSLLIALALVWVPIRRRARAGGALIVR